MLNCVVAVLEQTEQRHLRVEVRARHDHQLVLHLHLQLGVLHLGTAPERISHQLRRRRRRLLGNHHVVDEHQVVGQAELDRQPRRGGVLLPQQILQRRHLRQLALGGAVLVDRRRQPRAHAPVGDRLRVDHALQRRLLHVAQDLQAPHVPVGARHRQRRVLAVLLDLHQRRLLRRLGPLDVGLHVEAGEQVVVEVGLEVRQPVPLRRLLHGRRHRHAAVHGAARRIGLERRPHGRAVVGGRPAQVRDVPQLLHRAVDLEAEAIELRAQHAQARAIVLQMRLGDDRIDVHGDLHRLLQRQPARRRLRANRTISSSVMRAIARIAILGLGHVADDDAVGETDHALGIGRDVGVMSHQHHRHALAVQFDEQLHHLLGGGGVERAGGLVGQEQERLVDDGARDRDALLLSARELVGQVIHAIGQPHPLERAHRLLAAQPAPLAGVDHRQLDVLQRVVARQQVEGLEDEADLLVAQRRELEFVEVLHRLAVEQVLALRRTIEGADEVEHGRLARPRRAHDGHQLAGAHGEVDRAQRVHLDLAHLIDLADPSELEDRRGAAGVFCHHL